MPRKSKGRTKRVKNLIVIMCLTAIVLSVSTYAWFIGMRTVNVSSFDVEVAVTDSLLLSLDGKKWDTTVSITKETYNDTNVVYQGHTNNWAGRGLLPMSSIGAMDTQVSRMKIFEKASLTTTPGGYRLMASRVNNYDNGDPEQDGYVVFDLFVRNFTGTQYLEVLNTKDEEAIYLTTDSKVMVAPAGAGGVDDTGIENSVRVAFTQIGRVAGTTTTPSKITGITCEPDENGVPSVKDGVTGICRIAQIWEPNDIYHVDDALRWYQTSCLARTGAIVVDPDSYGNSCGTIEDGTSYPTYAVSDDIASSDNIDIYDGAEYNKYVTTTDTFTYDLNYTPYAGTKKLVSYPYFTDTMKDKKGTQRPTFMTLAPNSITKLRIYIYIEGQDIDNYDFASIGKMIRVNFGFTKERYIEDDFQYNGPDKPTPDVTKPIITLVGDDEVTVGRNSTYVDQGATATDLEDGNLTTKIQTVNPVNTKVPGEYIITYNVSDWSGNYAAQVTRKVTVTEE